MEGVRRRESIGIRTFSLPQFRTKTRASPSNRNEKSLTRPFTSVPFLSRINTDLRERNFSYKFLFSYSRKICRHHWQDPRYPGTPELKYRTLISNSKRTEFLWSFELGISNNRAERCLVSTLSGLKSQLLVKSLRKDLWTSREPRIERKQFCSLVFRARESWQSDVLSIANRGKLVDRKVGRVKW